MGRKALLSDPDRCRSADGCLRSVWSPVIEAQCNGQERRLHHFRLSRCLGTLLTPIWMSTLSPLPEVLTAGERLHVRNFKMLSYGTGCKWQSFTLALDFMSQPRCLATYLIKGVL